MVQADETTFWIDPAKVDPCEALADISDEGAEIAVVGGQRVFDWVLAKPGFSSFQLSLAHQVRLGRGQQIFRDATGPNAALMRLESQGLSLSERAWLDEEAGLELLVYRQP